jgi:hypothetical protein
MRKLQRKEVKLQRKYLNKKEDDLYLPYAIWSSG